MVVKNLKVKFGPFVAAKADHGSYDNNAHTLTIDQTKWDKKFPKPASDLAGHKLSITGEVATAVMGARGQAVAPPQPRVDPFPLIMKVKSYDSGSTKTVFERA
jgi:hypothetical protein